MTVVVIAPHPDDEAIGCGGAVGRHVADGEDVHVVFLSSGELALKHLSADEARRVREDEARGAAEVLGAADPVFLRFPDWSVDEHADDVVPRVAEILAERRPSTVYVPHEQEWHPDHRAAHTITRAAAQRAGVGESALLRYEVWTPLTEWDVVEDIGDLLDLKLRSIRSYPSQLTEFDYVRAATGLAQYRGALAGRCEYAEVFDRVG